MKLKWLVRKSALGLLLILACISLAGHDGAIAAQDGIAKIESQLFEQLAVNGSADFIIRFSEQADLSSAYAMDWQARGEFVYRTLVDTASRSQAKAKAILDANGTSYQTFFAGNDLYVWGGNQVTAVELSALTEVESIRTTRVYQLDPSLVVETSFVDVSWAGELLAGNLLTSVSTSPATFDWGITDTNADDFWTTFGVRGDGIVVANIDTGVDYTHDALDQNYKCATNPSSLDCWFDPGAVSCSGPGGGPCDSQAIIAHGTHVMGTEAGDDDPALPYQVGMAPDAQWIACLGCPMGDCPDYDLNMCADWLLAPNGNPTKRPHIVNNSWGSIEDGDTWFLPKVNAWRASGIFPAFSAGNKGPTCDTLGDPGSYQEAFASAAHDSSRTVGGFSSRGPSAFGHDPYTKPNLSAPGVNIRSAKPGDDWQFLSGTSQASPHTAGAVALLWSCDPGLIGQVDATFQLLQNSAGAAPVGVCGAPPDSQGNYTYGYGYLDVLAAGNTVCGLATGTLRGYVYDLSSGNPLAGVLVTTEPAIATNQPQAMTDPSGFYNIELVAGRYHVTASKAGYVTQTANDVVVARDGVTTQDFSLVYLGQWQAGPSTCFDLTRFDAEYYPGTGLIYILGGRFGLNAADNTGTIYSFNPQTGECLDTGADMPVPVANYTISLVNDSVADLLCTFGGYTAAGTSTSSVQCFNPITNEATLVTNLPAAYNGYFPGAQVVVANWVFIFGGFRNDLAPYELARTDRYNPVTHSFTQVGDLSLARGYIDAAVVDGRIYAFGGAVYDVGDLVAQTRTEVMVNPGGVATWNNAAVAELPSATAEGRAFGFDLLSPYQTAGQIVIAGGGQWPGETAEVFTYDIASDSYDMDFPDLIDARRCHAAAFVPGAAETLTSGRMWVFGGRQAHDIPPYMPAEYFELPIARPNIVSTPALLEESLTPYGVKTTLLTLRNTGTSPLGWLIGEVPGSMALTLSPSSAPAPGEISPLASTLTSLPAAGHASEAPTMPEAAVPFTLDDGSAESFIGLNGTSFGQQFLWFNRFTPSGSNFPFFLNQVQVLFGLSGVAIGDPVDLVVYQDTDGDGDPSDATWLATYRVKVKAANGVNWSVYDLPLPVKLVGPGDVLVGVISRYVISGISDRSFPAALDTSTSQLRSWLGAWSGDPPDPPILPANALFNTIDFFGYPGNWLIRGVGQTQANVPWIAENPGSGSVPIGGSATIVLTLDAHGLALGEYSSSLDLYSNDPDTPLINIPITLTVELTQIFLPITIR